MVTVLNFNSWIVMLKSPFPPTSHSVGGGGLFYTHYCNFSVITHFF